VLRTIWLYIVGLTVTPIYAVRAIWLGRRGRGCACEDIARRWSRLLLKAGGIRVEVEDAGDFDPEAAHIVVANHSSWFDVFALAGYLPGHFRFVAKKELAKIPLFGPAWVACGHVSIDRSDRSSAVDSLAMAAGRIRDEHLTIVLFAEGTRSQTGQLQPFKKGAFVLAIQSGVPVVPVAILGSREVMPKGRWRIRPGTIRVRIGTPIAVDALTHADRDRLKASTWQAVATLKGESEATVHPIHNEN